ncbi:MAG: ABC transporter substrate-binding protein [Candidatus Zixiibacteriota bacterium]
MKKLITIILILAVASVGLILGCAKEEKEIRIGVILPLTGSLAKYGEWSKTALEIARDQINVAGGINGKRIELLLEDSRSEPKDAVTVFRKLVNLHRVPVIVGLIGSSEVLACAPVANETRTVLLSTVGASPKITEAGDYVFRVRISGTQEVTEIARIAYNKLGLKRMAVLFINTDYGLSYKDIFVQSFQELGGEILLAEGFDQGETDFRTHLTKLKKLERLDGVYLPTHITEGANIVKQAREIGLRIQFLASNAIEGPELLQIAGDAAEGLIYTAPWYDPSSSETHIRRFDDEFFERTGMHSEMFAAHAYDALRIVASVLETNEYRAESIKKALYSVKEYPGVSGLTTFDSNGDVTKPVATKKVVGGRFIFVE